MESDKEIGLNLDNLEPDSTKSAKCSTCLAREKA